MPIYEYKCENGHLFDVMRKMSEDPLTACVECGAPVRKVLHPVNISFKGSGFYSTDYKNGSRSEKTEKSETASGNGDSSGKSPSGKDASKKTGSSPEKAAKKQD
jgi:putative FmdB family regulatory protein